MRRSRLGVHALALFFFLSAALNGAALNPAQAGQSPTILSKQVASFSVRGLCLVDALLRLGGQEQVPMGIEYVSRESLEKLITEDFHNTTVEGILEHLLGSKGYCWRVQDDVVDVSHKSVTTGKANLLNHVLPTFVIRRCSVADASNVLYMSLNSQLHSEVTGYAGDIHSDGSRNPRQIIEQQHA